MLGLFKEKKLEIIPEREETPKLVLEEQLISKENLKNLLLQVDEVKAIAEASKKAKEDLSEKDKELKAMQSRLDSQRDDIKKELLVGLDLEIEQINKQKVEIALLRKEAVNKSKTINYLDFSYINYSANSKKVIDQAINDFVKMSEYDQNKECDVGDDLWQLAANCNLYDFSNAISRAEKNHIAFITYLTYTSYVYSNNLSFDSTSLDLFVSAYNDQDFTKYSSENNYGSHLKSALKTFIGNKLTTYNNTYLPMKRIVENDLLQQKVLELQAKKLELELAQLENK